jgi:hypothetical protein
LALAVEAGLHFLRMLDAQPMSKSYRAAFAARFSLQPMLGSPVSPDENDEATVRFMQTMTGRAPDARRLAAAFRPGSIAQMLQDGALEIDAGDRAEVQQAALAWLAWYDALVSGRPTPPTRHGSHRGWNTRCRSPGASRRSPRTR